MKRIKIETTYKIPLVGTPTQNRQKLLECSKEIFDLEDKFGKDGVPKESMNDVVYHYGLLFTMAVVSGILKNKITREEITHYCRTGELHLNLELS